MVDITITMETSDLKPSHMHNNQDGGTRLSYIPAPIVQIIGSSPDNSQHAVVEGHLGLLKRIVALPHTDRELGRAVHGVGKPCKTNIRHLSLGNKRSILILRSGVAL